MLPGRRPTPSHLKLITGNPGHRPVEPEKEARVSIARPDRPLWLNADALREWDRIVPDLEMAGLLTRIDGAALAAYCSAYAMFQKAEAKIQIHADLDAENAGLIEDTKNGFKQMSQWLVIRNKALEQLRQFATEFGMSPSSRARAQAVQKQMPLLPDDPLEAHLRASGQA